MTTVLRPLRSTHALLGAAFFLFALNYNRYYLPGGDAQVPLAFVRRLAGEDVSAIAYQFGLALMELPFYVVGKAVAASGVDTIFDQPTAVAFVAISSSVYAFAAAAITYVLLGLLQLRRRAVAVALAVAGTPLLYYGVFFPGSTHPADTFLIAGALALLLVHLRRPSVPALAAAGALLGVATTVRYLNGAEVAALVAAFLLLRRYRDAGVAAAAAGGAFVLLLLVPIAAGVPLFGGAYTTEHLTFRPLNPILMLFTDHRGLFVWTPLTLLGAIGYVRLARARRDDRTFLVVAAGMAAALVVSYVSIGFWNAGWSFSQRYYTALFPLVAIGVAALLADFPRPAAWAAAVSCVWSLFLAFYLLFAFHGGEFVVSEKEDGATDLALRVARGRPGPVRFAYRLYAESRLRFALQPLEDRVRG